MVNLEPIVIVELVCVHGKLRHACTAEAAAAAHVSARAQPRKGEGTVPVFTQFTLYTLLFRIVRKHVLFLLFSAKTKSEINLSNPNRIQHDIHLIFQSFTMF